MKENPLNADNFLYNGFVIIKANLKLDKMIDYMTKSMNMEFVKENNYYYIKEFGIILVLFKDYIIFTSLDNSDLLLDNIRNNNNNLINDTNINNIIDTFSDMKHFFYLNTEAFPSILKYIKDELSIDLFNNYISITEKEYNKFVNAIDDINIITIASTCDKFSADLRLTTKITDDKSRKIIHDLLKKLNDNVNFKNTFIGFISISEIQIIDDNIVINAELGNQTFDYLYRFFNI